MKGVASSALPFIGGVLALVLGERLLRHTMADHTVVSQLLAPGGLADSAPLVGAVSFFGLRLLVVGCLPGLVLARLARLMFRRWAPQIRPSAAPELPGGRPQPPKSTRRPGRGRAFRESEGP